MDHTVELKSLARELGVDLFGVADLKRLEGIPFGSGGDCKLCVDQCPYGALRLVSFADHPERREDVLDVKTPEEYRRLFKPWAVN
ncbi:MAG: hypothetical protein MUP71_04915 [Candidatus Aminicenantes bacterium]|nr:hypothetical protein [Candidatus Aminicenantes bacterium]